MQFSPILTQKIHRERTSQQAYVSVLHWSPKIKTNTHFYVLTLTEAKESIINSRRNGDKQETESPLHSRDLPHLSSHTGSSSAGCFSFSPLLVLIFIFLIPFFGVIFSLIPHEICCIFVVIFLFGIRDVINSIQYHNPPPILNLVFDFFLCGSE